MTLPFLFPFYLQNANLKEDLLIWNAKQMLTWDDFKGKPEKRFAAASTHYDILKKVCSDKNLVIIKAVFIKNKSWKKKSWVSDDILLHEQKHFDIVELYSRKLRKLIAEEKYTSAYELNTKTDSLYKLIDKELDLYQDQYDDETNASMNGEKQRIWNESISTELIKFSAYSDTSVVIYIAK